MTLLALKHFAFFINCLWSIKSLNVFLYNFLYPQRIEWSSGLQFFCNISHTKSDLKKWYCQHLWYITPPSPAVYHLLSFYSLPSVLFVIESNIVIRKCGNTWRFGTLHDFIFYASNFYIAAKIRNFGLTVFLVQYQISEPQQSKDFRPQKSWRGNELSWGHQSKIGGMPFITVFRPALSVVLYRQWWRQVVKN